MLNNSWAASASRPGHPRALTVPTPGRQRPGSGSWETARATRGRGRAADHHPGGLAHTGPRTALPRYRQQTQSHKKPGDTDTHNHTQTPCHQHVTPQAWEGSSVPPTIQARPLRQGAQQTGEAFQGPGVQATGLGRNSEGSSAPTDECMLAPPMCAQLYTGMHTLHTVTRMRTHTH